jgi:hypothetical protein
LPSACCTCFLGWLAALLLLLLLLLAKHLAWPVRLPAASMTCVAVKSQLQAATGCVQMQHMLESQASWLYQSFQCLQCHVQDLYAEGVWSGSCLLQVQASAEAVTFNVMCLRAYPCCLYALCAIQLGLLCAGHGVISIFCSPSEFLTSRSW